MNSDLAISLTQDMLWNAAWVAAPVLGVAMIVGLLISILQVVTQIQEMTLTFVPKMLSIVVILAVCGPWMLSKIVTYSETLIRNIPNYF